MKILLGLICISYFWTSPYNQRSKKVRQTQVAPVEGGKSSEGFTVIQELMECLKGVAYL